jgi:hypothetical protein
LNIPLGASWLLHIPKKLILGHLLRPGSGSGFRSGSNQKVPDPTGAVSAALLYRYRYLKTQIIIHSCLSIAHIGATIPVVLTTLHHLRQIVIITGKVGLRVAQAKRNVSRSSTLKGILTAKDSCIRLAKRKKKVPYTRYGRLTPSIC